jgi:hypothetical protein
MEHEKRGEELEREVQDLEKRSDEVQKELDETKSSWESAQHDETVPGAVTEEDIDTITGADEDSPDEGDQQGA